MTGLEQDIDLFMQEESSDLSDNEASRERSAEPARSSNEDSEPAAGGQAPTDDQHNLEDPHTERNVRAAVTRAACRAHLHPYQVTEVNDFMTWSTRRQFGEIFVGMHVVRNDLSRILVTQPRFTINEALDKTIKSYSMGVLLSEKLRAYKNSSTDVVLTIIKSNGVNTPANLDQDPYALNVVKVAIADALTQARSRIKKMINESVNKDWSIYTLASKVIDGTQCDVSILLCARLAVMCRPRILSRMLKKDRKKFGNNAELESIPDHVTPFQQQINDSL
ncbi:hypothetical protein NP233_g10754 [Leucocoprinus birnbaumii]|uniref:Uncharacterized protein n=1 Tax=Leucocoprinus birnbaumii TaxID=56174 RepID=A0AAD5VIN8_9AGAR|nr:hypothetical protein NP233_g10754 [Leucocoprinus birnbaumii]